MAELEVERSAPSVFQKGEKVYYFDKRTGKHHEGHIIAVDHTCDPPSYGVHIPALDATRETVATRLSHHRPCLPQPEGSTAAAAPPAAAAEEAGEASEEEEGAEEPAHEAAVEAAAEAGAAQAEQKEEERSAKKKHRRRRSSKPSAAEREAAAGAEAMSRAPPPGRQPRRNAHCWQPKGESFEEHPATYADHFWGFPPAADYGRFAYGGRNPFARMGWP